MKMIPLILGIFLLSLPSFGEVLTDVEILEIKNYKTGEELKLRDKILTPDGYFIVVLEKKDKDYLNKSAIIKNKLIKKEKFKLILDIDSFSATPAGSMYSSTYVEFKGKE